MIFWMMPDNAAHTQDVMDDLLADFRKDNPDVDIKIRVINRRTFWAKIFTLKHQIGKETCPDIIAIPHYWTELLTRMEVLENLTELDKTLRVDNSLDPIKPHSYKNDSADIYSYPWWVDVTALHYREDHLKLITDNPQEMLSTWQGMLDACQKLKEYFSDSEGYYPMQNSDWRGSLSNRGVLPCLWSRGAYLFNEDATESGLAENVFEQGLEDFARLAANNYMPILRERSSLGTISSGKSSIVITRRQGISVYEAKKQNFTVKTLPVPKTGANYVNYLGAVNLAVVRSSAHRDNALKLLKFITSAENQIKYASATEVFPALDASFEQFLLSSPERIQNYPNIIANARTLPNHMATGTVMEILAELMSSVSSAIVMNKYSPELLKTELKKAKQEADDILHLYSD